MSVNVLASATLLVMMSKAEMTIDIDEIRVFFSASMFRDYFKETKYFILRAQQCLVIIV